MDYEEYKRKALEPIVNYIESVMDSYSKEELEAIIKKALPKKESEDERIKRFILTSLNYLIGVENSPGSDYDKQLKEAYSWLEKQKEQPSLPSNLDEAAEKIASGIVPTHPDIGWDECFEKIKDGIKAGAEWMAGQFKTLGETEIYLEDDGGEEPYTQEWLDLATTEFAIPDGFKPGDKVVVQIRKK